MHESDVVDVRESGIHGVGVGGRRVVGEVGMGIEQQVEDAAGAEADTVVGGDEDFCGIDHANGVAGVVDCFDGGSDLDDVRPEGAFRDERRGVWKGIGKMEIVEGDCIGIVYIGDDECYARMNKRKKESKTRTVVIEGGSGKSLVNGDDAGMTNASPGLDSGESGLVDETVI